MVDKMAELKEEMDLLGEAKSTLLAQEKEIEAKIEQVETSTENVRMMFFFLKLNMFLQL